MCTSGRNGLPCAGGALWEKWKLSFPTLRMNRKEEEYEYLHHYSSGVSTLPWL